MLDQKKPLRVALAHDSLTQFGGAERVLAALHEMYPDAPVFTLVYDKKMGEHFEEWEIVSSPLQYIYNLIPRFQWLLPLIPIAIRFFDFSKFDVVISSSSVFIKAIHVPKGVLHINYCHTPSRLIWIETDKYLKDELPAFLRPLAKLYLTFLRRWDYAAAQRVSFFIANSKNVQERIRHFYNRESVVVYPFADLETFYPTLPKEDYYLTAGRIQPHKHIDLVVKAFNKLSKKLHVVGVGRAGESLKALAKPNITFLGKVPDHVLRDEYSAARAFIFPQDEDFGLTPLEANACATAVVAYAAGGALETVIPSKTGVLFPEQTEQSLIEAIQKFETTNFLAEHLVENAEKFSKEKFMQHFESVVNDQIVEFERVK